MAPVIWGLDLSEIKFSKFKSSYMFGNKDYHLRRTKFIIYQCALIFPVVSESLGTAALSDYLDAQDFVDHGNFSVHTFNNDYVGVGSFNVFAGVFNAFIFGAAFFFDLFFPERKESRLVRISWKVCGVLSCVFLCAAAFSLTVITAKNCMYFTGTDASQGQYLLSLFHKDGGAPLCYRHDSRAVAATVFVWPGFLFTVASCILLFRSIDHTDIGPGPKSRHARLRDAAEAEGKVNSDAEKESEEAITASENVYQKPQDDAAPHAPAPVADSQTTR